MSWTITGIFKGTRSRARYDCDGLEGDYLDAIHDFLWPPAQGDMNDKL